MKDIRRGWKQDGIKRGSRKTPGLTRLCDFYDSTCKRCMNDGDVNWNLVIDENGKLMTKNSNSLKYKEVVGMRPAFDINSEEGYVCFLAEIADRKYCEAIVFTFKY